MEKFMWIPDSFFAESKGVNMNSGRNSEWCWGMRKVCVVQPLYIAYIYGSQHYLPLFLVNTSQQKPLVSGSQEGAIKLEGSNTFTVFFLFFFITFLAHFHRGMGALEQSHKKDWQTKARPRRATGRAKDRGRLLAVKTYEHFFYGENVDVKKKTQGIPYRNLSDEGKHRALSSDVACVCGKKDVKRKETKGSKGEFL